MAHTSHPTAITVSSPSATRAVSPTLFGLFLEDINFAGDGGLNANLVNNHSFSGVYAVRGTVPYVPLALVPAEHREQMANTPPELLTMPAMTPAGRTEDPLRHWTVQGGSIAACSTDPVAAGARFARVTAQDGTEIENLGYPGSTPGMSFVAGAPLTFSVWVRSVDFTGTLEVRLALPGTEAIATASSPVATGGWQRIELPLTPSRTGLGSLQLVLHGGGVLDIDEVRLVADDHWGAGDPRWSQGVLRRDLVETLSALEPRFMRFPGGCIVEGCGQGSHYKWKDTVGPLVSRRAEYSLWGQAREDGDYSQSNQVGFYEYFLLCEDLEMVPVPVVWSGDSCQTRMDQHLDVASPEFAQVVQDALDLIDWATGDPSTSTWAALRAEAGHPEPFALSHVGIGNENFGPEYLEHFALIKQAIDRRYPGLTLIVTGGVFPDGETVDPAWRAWGDDENVLVDEHFYNPPSWFFDSTDKYATYPRGGAQVFLGEYAAHTPYPLPDKHAFVPESLALPEPNTWLSAVAEAAFLTGVERNADVVAFSCYAPLFNLVENGQWEHNLIDFDPAHVIRTANYLVQQLFATHLGDRVVPISGDLPAGVFISATTDDDRTFIKLVNASSNEVDLPLTLVGAHDGEADGVLLHAPLDAVNRLPFGGEPQVVVEPVRTSVRVQDAATTVRLPAGSVSALAVPLTR